MIIFLIVCLLLHFGLELFGEEFGINYSPKQDLFKIAVGVFIGIALTYLEVIARSLKEEGKETRQSVQRLEREVEDLKQIVDNVEREVDYVRGTLEDIQLFNDSSD